LDVLIALAFVVGVIVGIAYAVKRTWPAIEYGRKLATALEVIAAFNYREVDSTMHGQPTAEARIAMEGLDE
jgi:hypothetical protein